MSMGLINSEKATVHAPNKDYRTVSIYFYIRASFIANSTRTPHNGLAPSYSFHGIVIPVIDDQLSRVIAYTLVSPESAKQFNHYSKPDGAVLHLTNIRSTNIRSSMA